MADISNERIVMNTVKKKLKYNIECPVCGKRQKVGVEMGFLRDVNQYPFTHIYLHGDPLHAMIIYIDRQNNVRSVESGSSIEIKCSGETFTQIMKKWSNPF